MDQLNSFITVGVVPYHRDELAIQGLVGVTVSSCCSLLLLPTELSPPRILIANRGMYANALHFTIVLMTELK